MSDEPRKTRTIGGLAPTRPTPDLSRLQARNRAATSAAEPAAEVVAAPASPPQAQAAAPATQPTKTAPKRAAATRAPRQPVEGTTAAKTKVSAYLTEVTYNRARAAFKSTAHLEDDSSWSSFVDAALSREAERRENEHNGGKPFDAAPGKLPAGRPLS